MTGEPGMRAAAIPVLLYHSVADTPAVGQEAFTVTPKRFAEHVAAIADAGLTALTVSDLAAAMRGERELPPRSVAVTFDDAFEDTQAAVERLRDAGIPSTVYVQSSGSTARAGRPCRRCARCMPRASRSARTPCRTRTWTRSPRLVRRARSGTRGT